VCGTGARGREGRITGSRNLSLRCECFLLKQIIYFYIFKCGFTGAGTGWCENSTRWKSHKRVRARGRGAWACLAHALQCLCDGRACCPARAMQLVICRSGGFTGAVETVLMCAQCVHRHVLRLCRHVWRTRLITTCTY
jgi:hypothetical protein